MRKLFYGLMVGLMASFAVASEGIVISTGGEGGGYNQTGISLATEIKRQASIEVEVITSNGSIENIERLNDGEAQMIMVQADALNVMRPNVPFRSRSAYSEKAFWVYNKTHDIRDLSDIEGSDEYLVVLVDGSGGEILLRSFAKEDSGYEANLEKAVYAYDNYDAADIVAEGRDDSGNKVAGMIYVGKSIPNEISLDFDDLYVGEMTDSDFNDAEDTNGDRLYETCEISKNEMGTLPTENWASNDTVCVKSMIVYSDTFIDRKVERSVKKAINRVTKGME